MIPSVLFFFFFTATFTGCGKVDATSLAASANTTPLVNFVGDVLVRLDDKAIRDSLMSAERSTRAATQACVRGDTAITATPSTCAEAADGA